MAYTVKQLSELSGVTVRTLHFYEEMDLLKPAYHGSNGYRYYEEKELLQLQQILFFKELGFSLKKIKTVLGRSDFDQLTALHSHKKSLNKEREKIVQLIKTIDKTINHLQGKEKMNVQEIFDGFNIAIVKRAKENESYFVAEALVLASIKNLNVEKQEQSYYDNLIKTAHAIFKEIVKCIENERNPSSNEVQRLIKKHHAYIEQNHNATKEVYQAFAKMYREHPAFREQLDPFHPQLAEFMAQAMVVFADRKL